MSTSVRTSKRKLPARSRAAIETLELRRMLSAVVANPTAFPLLLATPADGTLASGTASPQSNVFTPAQIASIYGLNKTTLNGLAGTGAGQTIAIVIADDDPALVSSTSSSFSTSDLHIFDKQFGIADPPSFTKIEQTTGGSPVPNTAWAEEATLDVEWTHALAPAANIDLVEAGGATASQLLNYGVKTAADLPGVSVVSMSFGFSEFDGENEYDADFTTPSGHTGVTFVASTGDTGVPGTYPAFSQNVLAVGGTTLTAPNGSYQSETTYPDSGGGISDFETKPSYQSTVTQSQTLRTIPDVSIDGDPNTGVDVYDSYNGGYANKWYQIAGTSFSAPAWAALIAIANQGRVELSMSELTGAQTSKAIYSIPSSDYHDITTGSNGYSAGPGYDLATGRGTPIANLLLPAIAGVSASGSTSTGTASIAGEVYVDANGNGKLDSGESALSGVELYVDLKQTGSLASGDPTYTTTSSGTYSFTNLSAGVIQVREVLPGGYKLTNPTVGYFDITVQNGWHITGENWGNAKTTATNVCSVAGYVYTDTNGNGKMDSGETGIAGVTMFIDLNDSGKFVAGDPTVVTNSSGYYSFSFTAPGTYRVVEVVPSGKHLTNPTVGYYNIVLQTGWNVTGENWGNEA